MEGERAVVNNEFDRLLAAMAARQDASELLQGLRMRPSQQESVPAEAPRPRARGAGRGSGNRVGIRRTAQPAAKAALQRNDMLPAPRAARRPPRFREHSTSEEDHGQSDSDGSRVGCLMLPWHALLRPNPLSHVPAARSPALAYTQPYPSGYFFRRRPVQSFCSSASRVYMRARVSCMANARGARSNENTLADLKPRAAGTRSERVPSRRTRAAGAGACVRGRAGTEWDSINAA